MFYIRIRSCRKNIGGIYLIKKHTIHRLRHDPNFITPFSPAIFYSLSSSLLLLLLSSSFPPTSPTTPSSSSSGLPVITKAFMHVTRVPVEYVPTNVPISFVVNSVLILSPASEWSVCLAARADSSRVHNRTEPSLEAATMRYFISDDSSVAIEEVKGMISKSLTRPVIPAAGPPTWAMKALVLVE